MWHRQRSVKKQENSERGNARSQLLPTPPASSSPAHLCKRLLDQKVVLWNLAFRHIVLEQHSRGLNGSGRHCENECLWVLCCIERIPWCAVANKILKT